jgi:transposase-like protein
MATTSRARASLEQVAYWRGLVDAWRGSGLSLAAYCKKVGISQSTLAQWARRFEREDAAANTTATADDAPGPHVVPVSWSQIAGAQVDHGEANAPLRLHVAQRFQIEIDADFCPRTLTRLVQTLEQLA